MGAGQDHLALLGVAPALSDRSVIEAERREARVAAPAVGLDDRARRDVGGDPRAEERLLASARSASRSLPEPVTADLDRDRRRAAFRPGLGPLCASVLPRRGSPRRPRPRCGAGCARARPCPAQLCSSSQAVSSGRPRAGAAVAGPRSRGNGWPSDRRPRTRASAGWGGA